MVKAVVYKMDNHPYGFRYNCQKWVSNDGADWRYCGSGRFCNTWDEVLAYCEKDGITDIREAL